MSSEARVILERYLSQLGLRAPADSAQQFQVTLMRQWADHLDDVLENNLPGGALALLRSRIIREFLYGAMPTIAEAHLREELSAETLRLLEQSTAVPPDLARKAT